MTLMLMRVPDSYRSCALNGNLKASRISFLVGSVSSLHVFISLITYCLFAFIYEKQTVLTLYGRQYLP